MAIGSRCIRWETSSRTSVARKDIGVVVDLHVEKTRGATTIRRALFHPTYVHKRSYDGVPDYAILPMTGNRLAFGNLHSELMQHIRGPIRRK